MKRKESLSHESNAAFSIPLINLVSIWVINNIIENLVDCIREFYYFVFKKS